MKTILTTIFLTLLFGFSIASAAELELARDGSTIYCLVVSADASPVSNYAAATLSKYLEQITGATFPVRDPAGIEDSQRCIFVGLSRPALQRLEDDVPLADLGDQEHVAKSGDGDIFLYGKGIHGNLWAVTEFLRNSLGWRWYSVHEDPVVPSTSVLTLQPFARKRRFTFGYREVQLNYGTDFYYQNGVNLGYSRRGSTSEYVSKLPTTRFVHTSFSYIPPTPDSRYADRFPWQDKKNYFQTNPDFFTMNEGGERVPDKQLCFGNPALREELTRNIYKDIRHAKERGWDELIVTLDAADTGGKFCHCPECEALEKKFQSRGGPLFDYLIELCGQLEEEYPKVMVRTLAYRRSQTQHPLVLPQGGMLPENLIVAFAPIEDNYFADWWNHRDPDIQETYRDMRGWSAITHHLWAWLYPNPWGTGSVMPVGNIERIVNNMRLMAYAGVNGVFTDHHGINHRSGFYELQAYLILQLLQDVNRDADGIIKDFTDDHYGAAAPIMRTYIDELERARKDMALPPGVGYKSRDFSQRTFPYLTLENIHRWQTCFDRMEKLTADRPHMQLNVRKERRELDFATLWKWFELKKKYPDYFTDYKQFAGRIQAVNEALGKNTRVRPLHPEALRDFTNIIKAGGEEKPLPDRFDGVDRSRIRTFLPTRHGDGPGTVLDPKAAMGYAVPVDRPGGLPFPFGFHQMDRQNRVRSLKLKKDDIVPGEYRLYEVGEVPVTPRSWVYFGGSWQTHLRFGERVYEPGAGNAWELFVSLKFDGPSYGGSAPQDQVLVGRVIAVSKSLDQFRAP